MTTKTREETLACESCWSYAQMLAAEDITDRGQELTDEARDREARAMVLFGDFQTCECGS